MTQSQGKAAKALSSAEAKVKFTGGCVTSRALYPSCVDKVKPSGDGDGTALPADQPAALQCKRWTEFKLTSIGLPLVRAGESALAASTAKAKALAWDTFLELLGGLDAVTERARAVQEVDAFGSCPGLLQEGSGCLNMCTIAFDHLSLGQRAHLFELLQQIASAQAAAKMARAVHVLSDYDDTWIASHHGSVDVSFGSGYADPLPYPGVKQLFYELSSDPYVTFLSARPFGGEKKRNEFYADDAESDAGRARDGVPDESDESFTAKAKRLKNKVLGVKQQKQVQCVAMDMLTGTWGVIATEGRNSGLKILFNASDSWEKYRGMAANKLLRFREFELTHPHLDFVFVGDVGQGDLLVAEQLARNPRVRCSILHDLKRYTDLSLAHSAEALVPSIFNERARVYADEPASDDGKETRAAKEAAIVKEADELRVALAKSRIFIVDNYLNAALTLRKTGVPVRGDGPLSDEALFRMLHSFRADFKDGSDTRVLDKNNKVQALRFKTAKLLGAGETVQYAQFKTAQLFGIFGTEANASIKAAKDVLAKTAFHLSDSSERQLVQSGSTTLEALPISKALSREIFMEHSLLLVAGNCGADNVRDGGHWSTLKGGVFVTWAVRGRRNTSHWLTHGRASPDLTGRFSVWENVRTAASLVAKHCDADGEEDARPHICTEVNVFAPKNAWRLVDTLVSGEKGTPQRGDASAFLIQVTGAKRRADGALRKTTQLFAPSVWRDHPEWTASDLAAALFRKAQKAGDLERFEVGEVALWEVPTLTVCLKAEILITAGEFKKLSLSAASSS